VRHERILAALQEGPPCILGRVAVPRPAARDSAAAKLPGPPEIQRGYVPYHEVVGDDTARALVKSLNQATPIIADDVWSHLYGTSMDDHAWTDLPPIAPPFEVMWVEGRVPEYTTNGAGNVERGKGLYATAALVETQSDRITIEVLTDQLTAGIMGDINAPPRTINMARALRRHARVARWMLAISGFVGYRHHEAGEIVVGPMGTVFVYLDELGKLILPDPTDGTFDDHLIVLAANAETREFALHYLRGLVTPALMTLGFMNCKNVTVEPMHTPESFAKLNRIREINRRKPLVRWSTVVVEPLKQILRESRGKTGAQRIEAALHIARGHFKTFTEERPLFGRAVGTYFWHQQVRGNAERGSVNKTYDVRREARDRAAVEAIGAHHARRRSAAAAVVGRLAASQNPESHSGEEAHSTPEGTAEGHDVPRPPAADSGEQAVASDGG
jgi:hypothetical protein